MARSFPERRGYPGGLAAALALAMGLAFSGARGDYAVQIGTYSNPANAGKVAQQLQADGLPAQTRTSITPQGDSVVRVIVGPYPDQETAIATRDRLTGMGFGDALITDAAASKPQAAAAQPSRKPRVAETARPVTPAGDIAAVVAAPNPLVPSESASSGPKVSGYLQNELGYIISGREHWEKIRNIAEVAVEGRANDAVTWKISGRGYYDPVFDVTNYYPDAVRDDRRLEGMLRETYVDVSSGNWDFRLGRQHIIWGEMVGLFFADVVSARDLREFILQDFDWIRTPQWAARAEYFSDGFHAEAIWIPYMTYDNIGKPGDDFYPYPIAPPPGYGMVIRNDERPSDSLDHSAYGLRLSWLHEGWDTSAFYYSSMDAAPAFERRIATSPEPTFFYTPIHNRIHQFGATVAKDFGAGVFKAEAVYNQDRLFGTTDLADANGLVEQNFLDYILGVEFVSENETRLNLQFFQRWFTDHEPATRLDDTESGVTLYLSTKALHPNLEPELLVIRSLNRADWLVQAKLAWRFQPNWRLTAGVDIFDGPPDGLFGQFEDSDRVYTELRYSF